jgi:DNA-binding PadR family transcriptional regulator
MTPMTDRALRRSPLAMVLLALLAEAPMHAYRMQQLIKERGKDDIVNITQRNSVYQTIERLTRVGLITVQHTARDAGRPERTVYEITDAGRTTLRAWLRDMLAQPARDYPEFPAALAFLPMLPPSDVRIHLAERAEHLKTRIDEIDAGMRAANQMGLPRLFGVESEFERAIAVTELAFVTGLLADLDTGELSWTEEWLREIAATFGTPE